VCKECGGESNIVIFYRFSCDLHVFDGMHILTSFEGFGMTESFCGQAGKMLS